MTTKIDDFLTPLSELIETLFSDPSNSQQINVDAVDYGDTIKVIFELPVMCEKQNIQVKFENQILTVSGHNIITDYNPNNVKIFLNEIKQKTFKRSFKLISNIDKESIQANIQNGLLYITLKKKPKDIVNIEIK